MVARLNKSEAQALVNFISGQEIKIEVEVNPETQQPTALKVKPYLGRNVQQSAFGIELQLTEDR